MVYKFKIESFKSKSAALLLCFLFLFNTNFFPGLLIADAAQSNPGDYEPQRLITSAVNNSAAGLNVSWVNPANALSAVKLYKADGALLTDSLSTASGAAVSYKDSTVESGVYASYKVEFIFADGTTREVYTSGKAGAPKQLMFYADPGNPANWDVTNMWLTVEGNDYMAQLETQKTIGANGTESNAVHIVTNEAGTANEYLNLFLYGGLKWNKPEVNIPGKYKLTFTVKGSGAIMSIYVYDGSNIMAKDFYNVCRVNSSENWQTYEVEYEIPETVTATHRTLLRYHSIDAGELWIDSVKLERATVSGETTSWNVLTNQEFEFLGSGSDYTGAVAPANVKISYTESKATLSWNIADTRTEQVYTNVYERIDGTLYLRASLFNNGKTNDSITLDYVTGDYIVKTHRLNASAYNDLGGSGTYSEAVAVLSGYEPQNVMATGRSNGLEGLNISWKNPIVSLSKVSIYSISGDDEALLSDSLTTRQGATASYTYEYPEDTASSDYINYHCNFGTVKLRFEFENGEVREVYVSGAAKTTSNPYVYHKGTDSTFSATGSFLAPGTGGEIPKAQINIDANEFYSGKTSFHLISNERLFKNAENEKIAVIRWHKNNQEYIVTGGKYRISAKVKGTATGAFYIRDTGANGQIGAKVTIPSKSDDWYEVSADYAALSPFTNQIDFLISDLTEGDLWIDDLKLEMYDTDKTTIKEVIYTDSFEAADDYVAQDVKVMSYETDTETVIMWKPYTYSAYTNIYEEINDELFLRAKMPNFGPNARTTVALSGIGKKYIVKSESGTLFDANIAAMGGAYIPYVSGTLSAGTEPYNYPKKSDCVKWCNEINALLEKCKGLGISTDYEAADYTVMVLFTDYIDEEYLLYDNIEQADLYYDDINAIYQKTKAKLCAYIDGSEKPQTVPEISFGELKLEHGHMCSEDGKPVIMVGYNDFLAPEKFSAAAAKLGFGVTQRGLHIDRMIKYDEATDGYIPMGYDEPARTQGTAYNMAQTVEFLEECRANNIKVNLAFDPMALAYVPDSDFKNEDCIYYGYIPYNATHPRVKQQVDAAAEVFVNLIKDYTDVLSGICFANEPYFLTNDKPYYDEQWVEYLKKKYPSVIELFAAYGTFDYTSIKRPADYTQPQNVLYRDYRDFNENVLREYFSYMSEALNCEKQEQGVTADLPLSIKFVPTLGEKIGDTAEDGRDWRRYGINYEKLVGLVDVNGMDSTQFISAGASKIDSRSMWRDYLTSVSYRMISDLELHTISDTTDSGELEYPELQNEWNKGIVWQSAIQGADEIALWHFGRTDRTRNQYYNASYLMRPKELSGLSKIALDIRRLTPEITALQNADRRVGILWSDTAFTFSRQMTHVAYQAYKACINNGERPLFVTENTLDSLSDCELLIVPGCINISTEMLNAINAFSGDILLIGDSKLMTYNENDTAANKTTVAAIKNKAETYELTLDENVQTVAEVNADFSEADFADYMLQKLKAKGLARIAVCDSSGNRLNDVEWVSTEQNGCTLISIYNKSGADIADTAIYIDGVRIPGFDELRSGEHYSGTIELKAYEPVLLSVPRDWSSSDYVWTKTAEGVFEAAVSVLNMSGEAKKMPVMIAAVYENDRLKNVHFSDNTGLIEAGSEAELKILDINASNGCKTKLMLWEDLSQMKPIKKAEIK